MMIKFGLGGDYHDDDDDADDDDRWHVEPGWKGGRRQMGEMAIQSNPGQACCITTPNNDDIPSLFSSLQPIRYSYKFNRE